MLEGHTLFAEMRVTINRYLQSTEDEHQKTNRLDEHGMEKATILSDTKCKLAS